MWHKTLVSFCVLSETPIPEDMDISDIFNEAIYGDYIMAEEQRTKYDISDKDVIIEELFKFGSEPSFFGLEEDNV